MEAALVALRISPEQKFFPRPHEVAAEIERQAVERAEAIAKRETRSQVQRYDSYFWEWVDSRLQDPDIVGMTEQQFLDTVKMPGWTGMKARTTA